MRRAALAAVVVVLLALGGLPAHASASSIVSKANAARSSAGLAELGNDGDLAAVAVAWSKELAASGRCSSSTLKHNPNVGSQIPSGWRGWGENVACGSPGTDFHALWMDSPGHRANILNESFTHIGVGVYESDGVAWATQVFANYPSRSTPAPEEPPAPSPEPSSPPKSSPKPSATPAPSASPTPADPAEEVRRAARAALVAEIQANLVTLGYPEVGPVDGAEGPKTRAAITAFQTDAGLAVTGRATREVRESTAERVAAGWSRPASPSPTPSAPVPVGHEPGDADAGQPSPAAPSPSEVPPPSPTPSETSDDDDGPDTEAAPGPSGGGTGTETGPLPDPRVLGLGLLALLTLSGAAWFAVRTLRAG